MVRIAHLSDTHLGYRQYNIEERVQDIYEVLDEIAEKIVEERADIIIHSGDLFDTPKPETRAYYEFKKFLGKVEGKAEVYTILGDHDTPKRRGMPPHTLFDDRIKVLGISGLEYFTLDINSTEIFISAISNLKRRYRGTLIEELRKADAVAKKHKIGVLILHQAIDKFLGYEEAFELSLEELPKSFTYYAMGHLHNRLKATYGRSGVLAYAGSVEIIRRDEISGWKRRGKGFYLVDIDKAEINIEEIKVESVRPQIQVNFDYENLQQNLTSFVNSAPVYAKLPIIHALIYGKEIDRQYVHQALSIFSRRALALSVRPEIVEETKEGVIEIQRGAFNINAILREYFEDKDVMELSLELLKLLKMDEIKEAKRVTEEYFNSRRQER